MRVFPPEKIAKKFSKQDWLYLTMVSHQGCSLEVQVNFHEDSSEEGTD